MSDKALEQKRFKRVSLVRTGRILSLMLFLWSSFISERALADANPSNDQAQVSVTIIPRDKFPPAAITDLDAAASVTDEGNVLLMWTAPDENNLPQPSANPVKEYFVRYATFSVVNLGGNTTTWWNNATDAVGEPFPPQIHGKLESFILTALEPGATIYFAIKSQDEKNNISQIDVLAQIGPQANARVLDLPPPQITGLTTSASSTAITLSWSASTATDIANYRIYWDTAAPADVFVPSVTVPAGTTSYTFMNLVPQNTYFFYVTALDKGQPAFLGNVLESTRSAIVSDFPREPAAPIAPSAPSALIAFSVNTTSITWQWQDNSTNETGFRLFSSTGGIIAQLGASLGSGGTVQFSETNLIPNTNYSRFVRAFNAAGESLSSNTTDRFTLAVPPVASGFANVFKSSVTLSWSSGGNPAATTYEVQSSTSSGFSTFDSLSTPNLLAAIQNLSFDSTYFFRVRARNGEGINTAFDATLSTLTVPRAPSNLVAVSITTNSITWQWQENSTSETGFRLYSTTGGVIAQLGALAGSGSTTQYIETNLPFNTNQSRFVVAFNGTGESLPSGTTSRFTLAVPPVASGFTNVFKTSVTVSWSSGGNPSATVYEVQSSTDAGFSLFKSVTVSALNALIQNLRSETTYFFRVRAQNGEGILTAFDAVVSTVTLPFIVEGLTAVGADQQVALDWLDTAEPNFAGYFVYRTTHPVLSPFVKVNLTAITTSSFLDTGLTNGTTYFYRVTILKDTGKESRPSEIVSAVPRKAFPPQEPTGIIGLIGSDGRFTIRWTPVTMDVIHSTRAELVDYRIYKSSDVEGPFALRDVVSSTITKWTSPESVPPSAWYYVKATDLSENQSLPSVRVFADLIEPKLAAASKDETMQAVFSGSDIKLFSAETNTLKEDMFITIDRNSEEEKGNTLTSYEIKALGADTLKEVKQLSLSKPTANLQFRFTKGISGAPMLSGTKLRAFSGSPRDVGIFWHNSIEYVKFGGAVNEFKGTVSIKTARPLGKFQVRQVLRANEFTLNQLTPRKIFTPNGDGVNDEIILFLENPRESIVTQAKIYDITGAEVADFEQGIVAGQLGIVSLRWDGRDKNGEIVRSGIYIYQVQAEGKVINGTIVVAR